MFYPQSKLYFQNTGGYGYTQWEIIVRDLPFTKMYSGSITEYFLISMLQSLSIYYDPINVYFNNALD